MALLRVAVIGSPGHGKSTFLNGLIEELGKNETGKGAEVQRFKAGCNGQGSVTKKVSDYQFDATVWRKISDDEIAEFDTETVRMTLIDTMGFPDPDPDVAADYYDAVVTQAVNHPSGLNALVWILNHDRPDAESFARFKVLMNQIASCRCKFIVVVNGRENYNNKAFRRMEEKEKQRKKKEDRLEMFDSCNTLLTNLGINRGADGEVRPMIIIPSTNQEELEEEIPRKLLAEVIDSDCVRSSVHTYASLKAAFATQDKAQKEFKRAFDEAVENRKRAMETYLREQEKIAAAKKEDLDRIEKQKQKEEAARKEKQEVENKAAKELEKEKAVERRRNKASIKQAELQEKSSAAEDKLKELNTQIEGNNDSMKNLEKEKTKIRESYSFAFGDTTGQVIGRTVWGVFSLGTSEGAMKLGRDRCYELMDQIDSRIAIYRNLNSKLITQRGELEKENPSLKKEIEEAKKREKEQAEEMQKLSNHLEDLKRAQKEAEAKQRKAEEERAAAQACKKSKDDQLLQMKEKAAKEDAGYAKMEQQKEKDYEKQKKAAEEKRKEVVQIQKYLEPSGLKLPA